MPWEYLPKNPRGWRHAHLSCRASIGGKPFKMKGKWFVVLRGLNIGLVTQEDDGWWAYNRGSTRVNANPLSRHWAVMTLVTAFWDHVGDLTSP